MFDPRLETQGTLRRAAPAWPSAALWLTVTLFTTGCFFKKTPPRVFVPPAVRPQPVAIAPAPIVDSPPELEADLTPAVVTAPLPTASIDQQLPAPPKPTPPPPRPPPAPPKIVPPPEPIPTPPKITQIFTPQELQTYNRTYDESMNRIERALADIAKKQLAPTDRDTVDQIRSFQSQARQAKELDLVAAVNFARKADLLAKDLLGRLR